ncbi:HAD family hydrolase [Aquibacillus kalidii]|uniref:HAD family hydrolase n=1 Tax=Aquibacillus kalidii TaxID=2762597 RepID=UPI0016466846|nr:HAD family hydrolase [Aquibacillus kalidii]
MTSIKAILFDKDGTLINFHGVWVKAIKELIQDLVSEFPDTEEVSLQLAASIGLHGNQVVADGILASGTMRDISEAFDHCLRNFYAHQGDLEELHHWISSKMVVLTNKYIADIRPTSEKLQPCLDLLRDKGIILGIATADDYQTTDICLEHLNMKRYFDFILTADTFPNKKPHPSVVRTFCEHYGIDPTEVAIVGDTSVDLTLAKNSGAGLAIGVLSGASNRNELENLADFILPTAADILTDKQEFVWDVNAKYSLSKNK